MKAITLTQPFATLVAIGAKRMETRSWHPPDRFVGERIAIHAGKGLGPVGGMRGLRRLIGREPFHCTLAQGLGVGEMRPIIDIIDALPRGAIVATAMLGPPLHTASINLDYLSAQEDAFGDFTGGRFAWPLRDVLALPKPLEWSGSQGFFNVPQSVIYDSLEKERELWAK